MRRSFLSELVSRISIITKKMATNSTLESAMELVLYFTRDYAVLDEPMPTLDSPVMRLHVLHLVAHMALDNAKSDDEGPQPE